MVAELGPGADETVPDKRVEGRLRSSSFEVDFSESGVDELEGDVHHGRMIVEVTFL